MTQYPIICFTCGKIVGASNRDNATGECLACYELRQLNIALPLGQNVDLVDVPIERGRELEEVVGTHLLNNTRALLDLAYNQHLEKTKSRIIKKIDIDTISHKDKKKVFIEARNRGFTSQDLTKSKIKPIKDIVDTLPDPDI